MNIENGPCSSGPLTSKLQSAHLLLVEGLVSSMFVHFPSSWLVWFFQWKKKQFIDSNSNN